RAWTAYPACRAIAIVVALSSPPLSNTTARSTIVPPLRPEPFYSKKPRYNGPPIGYHAKMRFIAILGLLFAMPSGLFGAEPVDFRKETRSVLQARCFACHGAWKKKGKLRVDSVAALAARGVVEPGQPAESELYRRISSADAKTRMPPEGQALTAEQIAKIKAWIAA